MNEYPGFDLAGTRGSRLGASTRRAMRLSLCLVLFAGVAAACGSSKSTEQNAQPSSAASAQGPTVSGPAASAQAPLVSFDPADYQSDGGGFSTNGSALEDAGYTDRYQGLDGLDHMDQAYATIVNGLPKAVDLNQTKAEGPGNVACEVCVQWQPLGRRDTALPPGGHGERIYELDVDLGPYLKGGDAVAYVWFVTRAQGNALDPHDMTATPDPYPTKAYSFTIDKVTAGALISIFWVKGAAPTAS